MKLFESRFSVVFLLFGLVLTGCKTTSDNAQTSPIPPSLIEPLRFANFTVSDINSLEGASNLMNEKVYLGEENADQADYDWIVSDQTTNRIHCETVKDFKAKVQNKCSDETGFGRAKYQWVNSCADTLDFMARARPSQHSYLNKGYLLELPVSILGSSLDTQEGDVSDKYEKILKLDSERGKTLKDYTKFFAPIHITKIELKNNTLSFYDSEFEIEYYITELARGDWDGDGNEDALIEIGWHTGGTLGGSYTAMVTKNEPDQKPKWVATNQFLKCSPNIVELEGTIQDQIFPGQPNYKSVANGDEREDCWVLELREPVNVAEDPEYPVPDENTPQLNVSEMQLNLDVYLNANYNAYKQFLGKRVMVTGELSQGFTVHHKTAILMWVRDIKLE